MTLQLKSVCVDALDTDRQARFWTDVLGWPRTAEEDGEVALTSPGGAIRLLFLPVPEPKGVKNRLHLDLRADDPATEVARVVALGARRVDVGQAAEDPWVVLADPEGNEFCILLE
jgi:catechol 2,3-dioxygenase-like lactoylglutathione lyase family enzyme